MNEIDALYYVEFEDPIWWKQIPCYYCDDESINIHTFDRQNGLKHFLIVLCHELAHHLQYLAGNTFEYLLESFENGLCFEKQAGRVAYSIYKTHFSHLCKIHSNSFRCYIKKSSLKTLRGHYAKYRS